MSFPYSRRIINECFGLGLLFLLSFTCANAFIASTSNEKFPSGLTKSEEIILIDMLLDQLSNENDVEDKSEKKQFSDFFDIPSDNEGINGDTTTTTTTTTVPALKPFKKPVKKPTPMVLPDTPSSSSMDSADFDFDMGPLDDLSSTVPFAPMESGSFESGQSTKTGNNASSLEQKVKMSLMMGLAKKAEDLQRQFQQMPVMLKSLLYGNESAKLSSEFRSLLGGYTKGRKNPLLRVDPETACLSKCEPDDVDEKFGCTQLQITVNCVAKCRPGVFADFVYNMARKVNSLMCLPLGTPSPFTLKKFTDQLETSAVQCIDRVLSDKKLVLKVLRHTFNCYLELESAETVKNACLTLKYCAIDATAAAIKGEWCHDCQLSQVVKFIATYYLTQVSQNGNLIRECPALYFVDY